MNILVLPSSRLYVVRGDSMRPTFLPGELLLVSPAGLAPRKTCRGDVVVVRDPRNTSRRALKRVVGLPGEQVRTVDGELYVDGRGLEEPYLGGLPSSLGLGDDAWRVGRDEYFVMGDNRHRSTDSRVFGPVAEGLIAGKAWFRCWPLRSWGVIRR